MSTPGENTKKTLSEKSHTPVTALKIRSYKRAIHTRFLSPHHENYFHKYFMKKKNKNRNCHHLQALEAMSDSKGNNKSALMFPDIFDWTQKY